MNSFAFFITAFLALVSQAVASSYSFLPASGTTSYVNGQYRYGWSNIGGGVAGGVTQGNNLFSSLFHMLSVTFECGPGLIN